MVPGQVICTEHVPEYRRRRGLCRSPCLIGQAVDLGMDLGCKLKMGSDTSSPSHFWWVLRCWPRLQTNGRRLDSAVSLHFSSSSSFFFWLSASACTKIRSCLWSRAGITGFVRQKESRHRFVQLETHFGNPCPRCLKRGRETACPTAGRKPGRSAARHVVPAMDVVTRGTQGWAGL